MVYSLAIIGGGLTATSMLCQLVDKFKSLADKGQQPHHFSIAVFEKESVFGPGLPHNEKYVLPFHITNMCAKDMSVRYDTPSDFQDWIEHHPEILHNRFPQQTFYSSEADSQGSFCNHYPRAAMGEYLKSCFQDGVNSAKKLGISVELFADCEVIDLFKDGKQACLHIQKTNDTQSMLIHADKVLLATGHWFEEKADKKYFPSPWPAKDVLASIPPGEKVGVLGSSLSAIELALTLTSDGCFSEQPSDELIFFPSDSTRTITLYSRNGYLPKVRGRIGSRPNIYLTCSHLRQHISESPQKLKLSYLFQLLEAELTAAYGQSTRWQEILSPQKDPLQLLSEDINNAIAGDGANGELLWQTILVQIYPVVRDLYLNLPLPERKLFDHRFNTLFFMHAATQPLTNAKKLLALMKAGVINIVKLGNGYRFARNKTNGKYEFIYTNQQGDRFRDSYKYVVNASGQSRSIESDPSRLTRNLIKRRLVQIQEHQNINTNHSYTYKNGNILVDPETHRVVSPDINNHSLADSNIFAVGAMTRGQIIDASMALGLARSTATVAEVILSERASNF